MRELAFFVELYEAKANKLFSKQQTSLVRFMRFYRSGKKTSVKCAHCGRKTSSPWTQLCSFRVADLSCFSLKPSANVYDPLTPVCGKHILAPEVEG